jgi:putative ABC transport system substrate-binding protein
LPAFKAVKIQPDLMGSRHLFPILRDWRAIILNIENMGLSLGRSVSVRRRDFITLFGGAAAWPLTAHAQQQTKVHRIAIVHPSALLADMSEIGASPSYVALFKALRRFGYVEGQNLAVERYSAEGREERITEVAREVVRAKPDLIVASTNRVVLSLKAVTDTIPVVAITADPLASGIVASLARPGGNITGVSVDAGLEIWGKRLQILREVIPAASKVGFLASQAVWDRSNPQGNAMRDAAGQAGISLLGPPLESPIQEGEYRRVFGAMGQEHADGLVVNDQAENLTYRRLIVDLAEKARLPTIYPQRLFFDIGGLMIYGGDNVALFRRLAGYIDQVLGGAKPGQIPIYLESKFELLLNLKTVKALGIEMPTSLLVRADEVIE